MCMRIVPWCLCFSRAGLMVKMALSFFHFLSKSFYSVFPEIKSKNIFMVAKAKVAKVQIKFHIIIHTSCVYVL